MPNLKKTRSLIDTFAQILFMYFFEKKRKTGNSFRTVGHKTDIKRHVSNFILCKAIKENRLSYVYAFIAYKSMMATLDGSCQPIASSDLASQSRISSLIYERSSQLKFGWGYPEKGGIRGSRLSVMHLLRRYLWGLIEAEWGSIGTKICQHDPWVVPFATRYQSK